MDLIWIQINIVWFLMILIVSALLARVVVLPISRTFKTIPDKKSYLIVTAGFTFLLLFFFVPAYVQDYNFRGFVNTSIIPFLIGYCLGFYLVFKRYFDKKK